MTTATLDPNQAPPMDPDDGWQVPEGDPRLVAWFHRQGPALPGWVERIGHFMICYTFDPDVGQCYPSMETIARACGRDKSQVVRAVGIMETAGYYTISTRPASNGLEHNVYTWAGLYSDWQPTVPNVRLSQDDIRKLQVDAVAKDAEIEALKRRLAQVMGTSSPVTENSSPDVSSSNTDISENEILTTTDEPVTKKRSPVEDEEAEQIEQALLDAWGTMGASWRGELPTALRWYQRRGRCGKTDCEACRDRFPREEHPHRQDFWRQLRLHQAEASKPRAGNRQGRAQATPEYVCEECGRVGNKYTVYRGRCLAGGCSDGHTRS